jgi:hypothetical protein
MRRTLGMLGIAVLVSVPGALGLASAAGAATPSVHLSLIAGPVTHATVPNSNLKGKGTYTPDTLKAKWTASKEKACTAKSKFAFKITNKTTKTQQVTYEGADFGTAIPAKGVLDVCADGTGTATGVFGVKSTKSTLTVTIT